MPGLALRAYHALPAPLRTVAATARGAVLARWRYGPETDALVDEALARDTWPAERWRACTEARLAETLHRAATRVPYYRAQWAARRRAGDRASWELLANWPVLEKEALRRAPRAFVADDRDVRRLFHDHTSGTTGTSLDVWLARDTVRRWYALFEARTRRWYGVSRRDRWAIVGGQLVAPQHAAAPPYWVWNGALRQLYLSAYHVAPRTARDYAAALRDHGVVHLLGYPSGMHALAEALLAAGADVPRLRVVVANAEPLWAHQRTALAQAFGAPVRETYGLSEICAHATECAHGTLHLWPEAGHVEVLGAGDVPVPAGEAGDLVATGLVNLDMPLVRYRVGDRVRLAPDDAPRCACGRTLPVLAGVEGRRDDVLWTRDGRAIGRLDPVFKAALRMREAQIVQEAADRVRVRYVAAEGYDEAIDGRAVADRLRERLGDVQVVLEPVPAIPRGRNGKFRAVVCALPAEEVARLRAAGAAPHASR